MLIWLSYELFLAIPPLGKIVVPSARWTMTNEVIEGNEWAAYGALDTYRRRNTGSPTDTSPAVYPTALGQTERIAREGFLDCQGRKPSFCSSKWCVFLIE